MQPLLLLVTATTIATMLPYSNLQPLLYATAIYRPSQKTGHGKHRSRSSHYCSSMMTSESKSNYLTITSNTISRSTVRKWFINFYIRWSIQWELTCSIYFWFCCRHYYQIWTALSVSKYQRKSGKYYTHARDASKMVPTVQNAENTTIQVPLFGAGTNSKNHDPRTGPPPKPIPTKNLRKINDR